MCAQIGQENPWLRIPATDYEGHMGPEIADQLSTLSQLFHEAYQRFQPATVAILGCATGNGLQHIDPELTSRVIALDLNPDFLEITRERHSEVLGATLEFCCTPVEQWQQEASSVDLIWAALLFEYGPPGPMLQRIARALRPDGRLSAVLQLPATTPAVTPTPYTSLNQLGEIMRLVQPEELQAKANEHGLELREAREQPLPTGKRFWVGLFELSGKR
jgi:SAM-dependent methyltransferase